MTKNIIPGYKYCPSCNTVKSLKDFYSDKSKPDGKGSACKKCRHSMNVKGRYGITKDEYDDLLRSQGYRCALCRRHHSEFSIRLSVDHNHKTGKVRGLLCNQCNRYLGYIKDSPDVGRRMISYL